MCSGKPANTHKVVCEMGLEMPTFSGLVKHGPYGVAEGNIPEYLFQTCSGYEALVDIQKEYAGLNDYLFFLSQIDVPAPESAEKVWAKRCAELGVEAGSLEHHDLQFDCYELSTDLHAATQILHAAVGATLTYFIFIYSLKKIVRAYSYEDVKISYQRCGINAVPGPVQSKIANADSLAEARKIYSRLVTENFDYYRRRGGSEFQQCIALLKDRCYVDLLHSIKSNQEFLNLLELMRTARNDFAHGDWGRIEKMLSDFKVKEAFAQSAWFLRRLEAKLPANCDSFFTKKIVRSS